MNNRVCYGRRGDLPANSSSSGSPESTDLTGRMHAWVEAGMGLCHGEEEREKEFVACWEEKKMLRKR
jgi:hypothetical protein